MKGNFNDEISFPHKLLLTNREVSNIGKGFANNSSTDINLSKTQLTKIVESGVYLGRRLPRLPKTGFPLLKNVIQPLTKRALFH